MDEAMCHVWKHQASYWSIFFRRYPGIACQSPDFVSIYTLEITCVTRIMIVEIDYYPMIWVRSDSVMPENTWEGEVKAGPDGLWQEQVI